MADIRQEIHVDALLRRLDVQASPDEAFVSASVGEIAPLVRAARRRDASWYGRLEREVRTAIDLRGQPSTVRALHLGLVVVVLALTLFAVLLVVGGVRLPTSPGNGPIVVSVKGQLRAIDPETASVRSILAQGDRAEGVSRSPDGGRATYWTVSPGRSRLFVIDVDGGAPRELAAGVTVSWTHTSDAWSPDSRYLATSVTVAGASRILVVDTRKGTATPLTRPSVTATNELWSPDGRFVAFGRETPTGHTLSVIGADGSGMRDLAGLDGLDVNGPDTWSPDGKWIYFGAADARGQQHAYRVDVLGGFRTQLSISSQVAPASVSSPDGRMVMFNVGADYGFDTWIANSDGTKPRLLLRSGGIGSWAADSSLILLRWRPADKPGGLATINPDGTGLTVLLPFDSSCRHDWDETCELGYGWGVSQP